MMRFRKKPVVIDAVQFNREGDHPAVKRAMFAPDGKCCWVDGDDGARNVHGCRSGYYIPTLEGGHEVTPGDWIIQGVKGELYPCKPDIFAATYEPASKLAVDPWAILERLQGQIAAEIRVMLGEGPYDQKMFDDEQRQRRIKAMQECAALSTSDADRHESWMKMHIEAGWTYGDEFDPANKKHPNLKPWDELPVTTRSKAKIFDLCAKAAAKLAS